MTLRVIAVGPGATIQDGGRLGLLRYGVTPAGPMDWVAMRAANVALGNAPDAAAVEIAGGGLTLVCERATTVAFCGGGFAWTLGSTPVPPARLPLDPGAILRARPGSWGMFAYVAVPGGIAVPPVMGSRATHMRSALGGLDGRMLAPGDLLPARDQVAMPDAAIEASWLGRSEAPIRVILGPQHDHFTAEALALLAEAPFTLTPAADRMAYKFAGPRLAHESDFNIVSDGVALGAIQVAGDGQILVLMADRQPTGGYAKIAHVCRADIGRLAQLRPGETCRFEVVGWETGRTALLSLEDQVAKGPTLAPLHRAPTAERLMAANLIGGVVDGRDGA